MIELSIPAVLGMVVVGLYNMMDSIFVGQMVGDVQMGAISVSYPLTLIKGNLAGAVPPDHSVYSSLRGSSDDRRHGYSWRMAGDCSDRCNSGGYYRFYDAL